MPREQDLPGSFVAKGAVLANVLGPEQIRVKVAVAQEDAGLIRSDTRDVQVALADLPGESLQGPPQRRSAGSHEPVAHRGAG